MLLPSEEWDYLDVDVLCPARSGAVCITCQHFRYEVGKHCVTVLICPIHQGLIPRASTCPSGALSGSLGRRWRMGGVLTPDEGVWIRSDGSCVIRRLCKPLPEPLRPSTPSRSDHPLWIPRPQRWRLRSSLRWSRDVIPSSAPFQRRSISRLKWAATCGERITSSTSSF